MLPTDKKARKERPIARGVLDYFPDAIAEVANLSYVANEQHNPGEPMHWAKEKSPDHADALVRHLIDRGKIDDDGLRHSTKVAWRAMALLQTEIEAERDATPELDNTIRQAIEDRGGHPELAEEVYHHRRKWARPAPEYEI